MTSRKNRIVWLAALLSVSFSGLSLGNATAYTPPANVSNYSPITVSEVKDLANFRLQNAKAAGRLTVQEATDFQNRLNNADTLPAVEEAWSDLEAAAQTAKAKHVSLAHLRTMFARYMDNLQKRGIVNAENTKTYRDRLLGNARIQKELTAKDHFFDFWEFVSLAIDVSSEQERLMRALSMVRPPLESLDELTLRSDFYMGSNDVHARRLTVYKSFEVEPDELQTQKQRFYQTMKDRAYSRTTTPVVREQLYNRLFATQYNAGESAISETELSKAIVEVQRLLDSGARNGNLGATDDVRLQHELELVKEIKKAYPGERPGIDPIEKELRAEQVRFMALDLRFLQDWLGRVLRKDGETVESREQLLRAVRRIDLAQFSGRISKEDALSLLKEVNDAFSHKSDAELIAKCREIEGRMDMMVSDYSMVPAKTALRVESINNSLSKLVLDRNSAAADKDRIQQLAANANNAAPPKRFGVNLVASAELELVRQRINALLKTQGSGNRAAAPLPGNESISQAR